MDNIMDMVHYIMKKIMIIKQKMIMIMINLLYYIMLVDLKIL